MRSEGFYNVKINTGVPPYPYWERSIARWVEKRGQGGGFWRIFEEYLNYESNIVKEESEKDVFYEIGSKIEMDDW